MNGVYIAFYIPSKDKIIKVGDKFLRNGHTHTCCYGHSYFGLSDREIPESGIVPSDIRLDFVLYNSDIKEGDECIRVKTGEKCTCKSLAKHPNCKGLGWFITEKGETFDGFIGTQVIKGDPIKISKNAKFVKDGEILKASQIKIKKYCIDPDCKTYEQEHIGFEHMDWCKNKKDQKFELIATIQCDKCEHFH